ncbi:acyl-CoA dehydrogenase family protein [Streptomyces rubradiris]|uniref:acyl-CoA dehydrogenase family protein n=1 Tax=Streptomyces rubradiris TaxID=285531 RepID=UPI00227D8AC0
MRRAAAARRGHRPADRGEPGRPAARGRTCPRAAVVRPSHRPPADSRLLAGRAGARVDAVGLVVRAAAREADRPDTVGAQTVRLSAAQALAMAAQMARRTAGEAMQIHGAHGMTEDSDGAALPPAGRRRVAVAWLPGRTAR